jgi:phasin family protein
MTKKPDSPIEQLTDLNARVKDYTLRFNKIMASGIAPAIREQAELAASTLESAMTHAERLPELKSPEELTTAQSELAKELGEKFQSTARKLLESQQETGAELKELLEEGIDTFTPQAVKQALKDSE